MQWMPCSGIGSKDTISGLQFSVDNFLACVTWGGTVSVVDPDHPESSFESSLSRPLFALQWAHQRPQLWFGGAEERVSLLDLDHCTTEDLLSCASPVLALKTANEADNLLVGSTRQSVFLMDPRICSANSIPRCGGAQCIDVREGKLAVARADQSLAYDLRNTERPLSLNPLMPGVTALQIQWLDRDTYAISDKLSHVHMQSLNGESFVFNSNRIKRAPNSKTSSGVALSPSALSRPIYCLTQNPADRQTLTTGGGDRHVYIWDYRRRTLRSKFMFPMPCMAIACSKDGRRMAVGLSSDEWSVAETNFAVASKAKIMISQTT